MGLIKTELLAMGKVWSPPRLRPVQRATGSLLLTTRLCSGQQLGTQGPDAESQGSVCCLSPTNSEVAGCGAKKEEI